MKRVILILLIMLSTLLGCASRKPAPQGRLVYCSYACAGAAGLGKDYCELIADEDSVPRVVVVLGEGNRFKDPVIRGEYSVKPQQVDSLCKQLEAKEVYKLAGYRLEEPITGGHSYRIYMEYSSGEKVDARWYGHGVKKEALSAYRFIERFFEPWVEQARTDAVIARVQEMEQRFNRLSAAVKKGSRYDGMKADYEALDAYMHSGLWKQDFEADEKGLLPKDLKRGVLSEDGLYDLLSHEIK